MVKVAKFLVLGAGLAGLLAFFLPLISVSKSGVDGKLSAFQIVKGIDSLNDVVEGTEAESVADARAKEEANEALGAVKGIVMALFVPALLLAVIGGIGASKKRFGRGLAVPSMLLGLVGLAIWATLSSAASDPTGAESAAGVGMHLLLLTGLGGTVGGLVGTIKPDRGLATP